MTGARVRIPPSPPKRKAHARHGPSALHLDGRDSKDGKENAAVRHFPAPGSTGKRLRRAERKQTAARAENPSFSAASGQALYRLFRLFSFHSQKPERAHAAAPPFRKRFRSVRLLACKRAHNGSPSLPTFCGAGPGRPMQGMGLPLCIWMGGIRRTEKKMPQCGIFPPRGARARGCAARSACAIMPRRGVFPP